MTQSSTLCVSQFMCIYCRVHVWVCPIVSLCAHTHVYAVPMRLVKTTCQRVFSPYLKLIEAVSNRSLGAYSHFIPNKISSYTRSEDKKLQDTVWKQKTHQIRLGSLFLSLDNTIQPI